MSKAKLLITTQEELFSIYSVQSNLLLTGKPKDTRAWVHFTEMPFSKSLQLYEIWFLCRDENRRLVSRGFFFSLTKDETRRLYLNRVKPFEVAEDHTLG